MIVMDEPMEGLLKPADIAKVLRKSEYTVKEMLRNGELKGRKIRNQWRMRRIDLQAFLDQVDEKPEETK